MQKKVPVSEICKKYDLNPQYVYQWQTQLFAEGAAVFERKNDKRTGKATTERNEKRIEALELEINLNVVKNDST